MKKNPLFSSFKKKKNGKKAFFYRKIDKKKLDILLKKFPKKDIYE